MQFGRYRLIERLGFGGMAEVFRAREEGPRGFSRTVALKRILPELAHVREFIDMLVTEARISALLQHPVIVQVFDYGQLERTWFLALELVEGCNLRELQTRCREQDCRLPPGLVCHIVGQVASALAYAHARTYDDGRPLWIVHRDVSPSNIMISSSGAVKLLDFGIAKAASFVRCEETRSGILRGKLSYMSPEQASSLPIDRRSDIFSLGIVLYECLVSSRLFKAEGDLETLDLVRRATVRPPSELVPGLDRALDDVVMKMLAAKPSDRYQHCSELIADLLPIQQRLGEGPKELERFIAKITDNRPKSLRPVEPVTQSQGSLSIHEVAPGVILYEMSGFLEARLVPRFEEAAAEQVARGYKVDLFFDTEGMVGHTTEFRHRMTEWHKALAPQTRSLNVLVRSNIVGMAIAVVNMVTGGLLKSYSNRIEFEAAWRAAVERARCDAKAPRRLS
jgi:serine/threonine protein kinase